MKRLKYLIFLASIVYPVTGCNTYNSAELSAAKPRNTIRGQELESILRDAYIKKYTPPEIIISHDTGELFNSNGSYHIDIGRSFREGSFSIKYDKFCVYGKGIPFRCRHISRAPDGLYYLTDEKSSKRTLVSIKNHHEEQNK